MNVKEIRIVVDEQLANEAEKVLSSSGFDLDVAILLMLKKIVKSQDALFLFKQNGCCEKTSKSANIEEQKKHVKENRNVDKAVESQEEFSSATDECEHFFNENKDYLDFIHFDEGNSRAFCEMPKPQSIDYYNKIISDFRRKENDIGKKMTKSIAVMNFRNNGYGKYIVQNTTFSSENSSFVHTFWANPPLKYLHENWTLILNDITAHNIHLFYIPADSISESELKTRNDQKNKIDLQIRYGDTTFTDSRSGYSFAKYLVKSLPY